MPTSVPSIAHIPSRRKSGRVRWINFVNRLELMWQVFKERDQLKSLDDHALKDLGLDRDQVKRETNRSISDILGNRL